MTSGISGLSLLDSNVLDHPYPFYRELRSTAPVWQVPDAEIFLVTDYALLEEAASRVEDFSSNLLKLIYRSDNGLPVAAAMGDGHPQILATADPPIHADHRRILAPFFTPKKLAALESEIAAVAGNCIDNLIHNGAGDFMSEVANVVPITIVNKLVGFQDARLDFLLGGAFDSTAVTGGALSETELVEIGLRAFEVMKWIQDQVTSALPEQETILSRLKACVDGGSLELAHATGMAHILLAAGGESTTSLIGNAVNVLATDQPLQQELRRNPELVPTFIEEVLRLESPFRSMLRTALKETTLGGVTIPAGSVLLLFWSAGNRDPKIFENPDAVDLHRVRRHMTFGRGIHMCIGAPLARMEGKIVVQQLLQKTSRITLDPRHKPERVQSLQVRRFAKLHVELDARPVN